MPNDEQLFRLSDLATSALLVIDRDPSFAQRVANATYWTIERIKTKRGSGITRQYKMERVGRSHAIFVAFDMVARFMTQDRVLLAKNAGVDGEKIVEEIRSQEDIEGGLKTSILYRASNQNFWASTTLSMNQLLIHGWAGSDPMDVQQWNGYFQRMLRSPHTRNGHGVEPYGKEATWRAQLVVLALKRRRRRQTSSRTHSFTGGMSPCSLLPEMSMIWARGNAVSSHPRPCRLRFQAILSLPSGRGLETFDTPGIYRLRRAPSRYGTGERMGF